MMTHNSLLLSTATYDDYRPRRYLSADDAVGHYLLLLSLVQGCPALDYERLEARDSGDGTSCENPHLEKLDEIHYLEGVFVATKQWAGDVRWAAWERIRVFGEPLRGHRGVPKSTIQRHTAAVDAHIEEQLYASRRLLRSQVRA